MAAVDGASPSEGGYVLKDVPVENLRPMRVVVIGAGYSGILAAIRIPEKLRNWDLTVYEKNEGVGGVWWANRYPGVACDIPSHSYQYTFSPNPRWSNLYAPGREIQQYLQGVAEKFGATRFIKTSHRVEKCAWDDAAKKWKITVTNLTTGETIEDTANIVITGRGQLNDVSWPDTPGLRSFKGKIMHSAEWDEEYDFHGKKVGVIGNGSSAIQIIPSLQKLEGVSLSCFMRSPTWIANAFGDVAMAQLGFDPNKPEFSEEQREFFAKNPEEYYKFRKVFEDGGNLIHDSTIPGTPMQKELTAIYRRGMEEKLATRPDLLQTIIPAFAPGCRRLTPGMGFLEALIQPNVEVISDKIKEVTETGVVLESGRTVELDTLVCATGFRVSEAPPFEVVGRNGLTLAQRWAKRPESYLSLAVDGFPNYLMMFGPNSAIGFGSLTKILEAETDYVVRVLRKVQKEDYATIEPKAQRVADFQAFVGAYFKGTVYMDKCKSWYRTERGQGDWICGLWPGSTLHALESLRSSRWEDFEYESTEEGRGNPLRWLGNGWSVTQTDGNPSWYIKPEEVEIPTEGKPEENPRYKDRPWSY
ncbi:FAD/NAD(P)-binding domain-containing protein [Thozetella sp. PMI_491]|nr:FAD/NAD(P)-binding domain-containing protein [Thozetella sp. PMI_491]